MNLNQPDAFQLLARWLDKIPGLLGHRRLDETLSWSSEGRQNEYKRMINIPSPLMNRDKGALNWFRLGSAARARGQLKRRMMKAPNSFRIR